MSNFGVRLRDDFRGQNLSGNAFRPLRLAGFLDV